MNNELPQFQCIQQTFANHLKSPANSPRPKDVEDRHMAIYRDLFFNNIMGFLSTTFPVLAEIMGEERWHIIGREFFSCHHNKTPYFLQISTEFLSFLKHEYTLTAEDPAYLYELAHYEWLELYVDIESEGALISCADDGDVLSNIPALSVVIVGCLYQYPVHQISAENSNPEPKPSALIVYRKRDDEVGFAETNAFTLQLLVLLQEGGRTGAEALHLLLSQNALEGQQAAYDGGVQTLQYWLDLGIIRGASHVSSVR